MRRPRACDCETIERHAQKRTRSERAAKHQEDICLLIIVSVLHLADHPRRTSFDAATFIRELTAQVNLCPKGDNAKLILLGDVFELLKTPRWHEMDLRPWH